MNAKEKTEGLQNLLEDSLAQTTNFVKNTHKFSDLEALADLLERAYNINLPVEDHLSTVYSSLTTLAQKGNDVIQIENVIERLENVASVSVLEHREALYTDMVTILSGRLGSDTKDKAVDIVQERLDLANKINLYKRKLNDISRELMEKEEAANGVSGPECFPSRVEVASYLGIKPPTFNKWIRLGKIKLPKTEVDGKPVYKRSDVDEVRRRIVTYPGGDPRLYDKPVFDSDWVMDHYGITAENFHSTRISGLLKHFDAITRKSKKGDESKRVKQYVYTESDLREFEMKLIENEVKGHEPKLAEQYRLRIRPVKLVEGMNGQADLGGALIAHQYGNQTWVVREVGQFTN